MINQHPLLSSISLVIPAYNDETTIARLATDSSALLEKVCPDYEIVLANDGSKDKTPEILQNLKAQNSRIRVINHQINQGYGRTIRELYLSGEKDLIFSLPGDYQYAPNELLAMAEGLKDHDFVIGLRVNRNDPWRRKLQSKVYNLMLRTLYGHKHADVNSIKLFKRVILEKVNLISYSPFVDAELCIRAEKAGFKVIELPIEHLPRLAQGASGGKPSVIIETFADLLKLRPTF
jgi:glycosyltransferase involved in cell wall biosynthesis